MALFRNEVRSGARMGLLPDLALRGHWFQPLIFNIENIDASCLRGQDPVIQSQLMMEGFKTGIGGHLRQRGDDMRLSKKVGVEIRTHLPCDTTGCGRFSAKVQSIKDPCNGGELAVVWLWGGALSYQSCTYACTVLYCTVHQRGTEVCCHL